MDFILFSDQTDNHFHFVLYDQEHDLKLTDLVEFHYIEMPKFNFSNLEGLVTPLEHWLYYMRYAANFEETGELPAQLSKQEGILMAHQAVHHALCDQQVLYELEARKKWILDQASNLHFAAAEGKAEGLAEGLAVGAARGREEALRRTALSMLAAGMERAQIFQHTGIALD